VTSLAAVVSLDKHKDCTARRAVDYWRVNLSITLTGANSSKPGLRDTAFPREASLTASQLSFHSLSLFSRAAKVSLNEISQRKMACERNSATTASQYQCAPFPGRCPSNICRQNPVHKQGAIRSQIIDDDALVIFHGEIRDGIITHAACMVGRKAQVGEQQRKERGKKYRALVASD
jgi:hypothetical protein